MSRLLVDSGLLASIPIKTKCDLDYYLEEEVYFCLMRPVEGIIMSSREIFNNENYKEKARYIGEIIGQLHNVIKNYENKLECNYNNLFENVTKWAVPIVKENLEIPVKFYDDYINIFGQVFSKLPNQIICYAYFSQFDKFEELKNINKSMTLWLYENIDCLDIFGAL